MGTITPSHSHAAATTSIARTGRRAGADSAASSSYPRAGGVGGGGRGGTDASIFATALDALVAILVQAAEILPHFLFPILGHQVAASKPLEPRFQPSDGFHVEFVLMGFEVAELGELLVAVVQFARERLGRGVDDFMSSNVAVLCKRLAADVTPVRSLARVATLVGLEVAQLAEPLVASRLLAQERFDAGMCAGMDFEMCFLVEGFATVLGLAKISLFGFTRWWTGDFLGYVLFRGLGFRLDGPHQSVNIGGKYYRLVLVRVAGRRLAAFRIRCICGGIEEDLRGEDR